jgi:hypothetical protein
MDQEGNKDESKLKNEIDVVRIATGIGDNLLSKR